MSYRSHNSPVIPMDFRTGLAIIKIQSLGDDDHMSVTLNIYVVANTVAHYNHWVVIATKSPLES